MWGVPCVSKSKHSRESFPCNVAVSRKYNEYRLCAVPFKLFNMKRSNRSIERANSKAYSRLFIHINVRHCSCKQVTSICILRNFHQLLRVKGICIVWMCRYWKLEIICRVCYPILSTDSRTDSNASIFYCWILKCDAIKSTPPFVEISRLCCLLKTFVTTLLVYWFGCIWRSYSLQKNPAIFDVSNRDSSGCFGDTEACDQYKLPLCCSKIMLEMCVSVQYVKHFVVMHMMIWFRFL